jgi:hypothetical protein
MAHGKAIPTVTEVTIGDMLASFTREQLFTMPTVDVNKAGVVLSNERIKVYMAPADGEAPVEFTVSLYIQRAAIGDDETAQVAKVASERKANADAKKLDEQARLSREKTEAFKLGQEATFGALRQLETLQTAAAQLAKQVHGK